MKLLRSLVLVGFLATGVVTTPVINTPAPMQTPANPNCEQFYLANPGDTCFSIAAAHSFDEPSFCQLNPVLGSGEFCSTDVLAGYWYCVKALSNGAPPAQATVPAASDPAEPAHFGNGQLQPPAPTHYKVDPAKSQSRPQQPMKTQKPNPPSPKYTRTTSAAPLTAGPPAPFEECAYGDCWHAFASISDQGLDSLESAAYLCTLLFNVPCKGLDFLPFPDQVKKGCTNCSFLSSGCPCFTAGKYHTYTHGPVWDRYATNHDEPWIPRQRRGEIASPGENEEVEQVG